MRDGHSRATANTPRAGPNWVSWTTSAGVPVAGCTAPNTPAATNATTRNVPVSAFQFRMLPASCPMGSRVALGRVALDSAGLRGAGHRR